MRKFLFNGLFLALACLGGRALADAADTTLAPAAPVSTPIVFEAATPAPTPVGGPSGPLGLTFSVQAGYTTVSMTDLNRSNAAMWGYFDTNSGMVRPLHDGMVVDLNLMASQWTPYPWLELGLRAEYLQTGTSELLVTDEHPPDNNATLFDLQDQGSMLSGLVGIGISGPTFLPGLNLGLHGWAGPGFARITQNVDYSTNLSGAVQPNSGIYSGLCLEGQMECSLSYQVASAVSLSFSGGWRWANVGGVQDSNGKALYEIMPALGYYSSGNPTLSPVNIDFSGATAKGSVDFNF
jgi:hypothetical protein